MLSPQLVYTLGVKIWIRLYGDLARHAPPTPSLDVPDHTTVADVIAQLGLQPGQVWLIAMDGQQVAPDHCLQAGQTLTLTPPVGGG